MFKLLCSLTIFCCCSSDPGKFVNFCASESFMKRRHICVNWLQILAESNCKLKLPSTMTRTRQWGECSDKHMSRLSIAPQKTLFQNMHYLPDTGASCPEFIAGERKSDNKRPRVKLGVSRERVICLGESYRRNPPTGPLSTAISFRGQSRPNLKNVSLGFRPLWPGGLGMPAGSPTKPNIPRDEIHGQIT